MNFHVPHKLTLKYKDGKFIIVTNTGELEVDSIDGLEQIYNVIYQMVIIVVTLIHI